VVVKTHQQIDPNMNYLSITMLSFRISLLLASIFFTSSRATYTLSQDYTGANFFTGFEFFTGADPTSGHVQFVDMSTANSTGIAGIMSGGSAHNAVYLGVDSTTVAPQGRGAIRVTSTQTFQHALVIADIAHMPGGICGTWPAMWMLGAGKTWPDGGEIDIVEGVNAQPANKMTLHTNAGVSIQNGTNFSGELVTPNCDIDAPGQATNAGCQIADSQSLTFGSDFNAANGGVYATEWTSDFIKIWFFPRGAIPSDVASGNPNPSDAWGVPNSLFQGSFNMDAHFQNLQIIFDTTFCGQWAGTDWPTSSCASLAPTCEAYVTNNPSAFADAYWAINTLQVFQQSNNMTQLNKIRRRMGGSVLAPPST
jgi:Glycosyl hydrolases family 16